LTRSKTCIDSFSPNFRVAKMAVTASLNGRSESASGRTPAPVSVTETFRSLSY